MNPYQWIEGIYHDDLFTAYIENDRESMPPHLYATSGLSYQQMITNG